MDLPMPHDVLNIHRFSESPDVLLSLIVVGIIIGVVGLIRQSTKSKGTKLDGPANPSFLFGMYRFLNEAEDPGLVYEEWAAKYGPAFVVPQGFGSSRIVICDPRANAHFYSKETFGYVQTKLSRTFIKNLVCSIFSPCFDRFCDVCWQFGRGLLWAEGESHRRQRKALSPAFSNAAIRKLTPVFYDAAYKV